MKFSLCMFSVKILSQPFLEAITDKIYLKMSAGFSQTPSTVSRFRTISDYNGFPLQLLVSVILLTGFTHNDSLENILRKLKVRKKISLICGIHM